jgi:hypothetical protein
MEALAGFTALIGLAFFIIAVLVVVEFLAIGFRVADIKKKLHEVAKENQDQTRYLAAISRNLALLASYKIPSVQFGSGSTQ